MHKSLLKSLHKSLPSRNLLVQSQQWKHLNNFEINSKLRVGRVDLIFTALIAFFKKGLKIYRYFVSLPACPVETRHVYKIFMTFMRRHMNVLCKFTLGCVSTECN